MGPALRVAGCGTRPLGGGPFRRVERFGIVGVLASGGSGPDQGARRVCRIGAEVNAESRLVFDSVVMRAQRLAVAVASNTLRVRNHMVDIAVGGDSMAPWESAVLVSSGQMATELLGGGVGGAVGAGREGLKRSMLGMGEGTTPGPGRGDIAGDGSEDRTVTAEMPRFLGEAGESLEAHRQRDIRV